MTWIQRYNLRHYVQNSVWLLPVLGMMAALASVNFLHWIEQRAGWQSGFDPAAALALFGTLAGSMLTFIVFLSSSLLLVVQLASAQLSPRIIGTVFRDAVTRFALTLFAFTFTFTLAVLVRIHASVPGITAQLSAYLCLLSVGVFLFLIDHVGKALRPSGALRVVARMGHEVVQSVYPRRLSAQQDTDHPPEHAPGGDPACTVPSLERRSVPGVRPCGARGFGSGGGMCRRTGAPGGGLRGGWESAVPYLWRQRRALGRCALSISCFGSGTDNGARPGFCIPDHGGYRLQGAFSGDQ